MRLHVESLIEYGGFCRVYVAQVKESKHLPVNSRVALKKAHVTKHVENPMLRHEAAALLRLRLGGHESVPAVYAWGRSQYYEYFALQLLGPSITSISNQKKPPTMRNLVAITCQMLDAVEHVHKHQIIHGDIKPGNFLFGTGENDSEVGRVYLIDYGLAKLYIDPKTSKHINDGTTPALRGTAVYASLNMHYHRMPSRRDDMESLAYTILKLLRGSLPWKEANGADQAILKGKWSGPALCGDYPPIFGLILEHARGMKFEEEPEYKRWRDQFCDLVPEKGEPLLYDSSDTKPPLVGSILGAGSPSDVYPSPPPSSEDSEDSLPDSDDNWVPTSIWPPPERVKPEDLLDDEQQTVADALEQFDDPPEMDKPYLQNKEPEICQNT